MRVTGDELCRKDRPLAKKKRAETEEEAPGPRRVPRLLSRTPPKERPFSLC